jgi:hypothetical protein
MAKRNNSQSGAGTAAASALAQPNSTPKQVCEELSGLLKVSLNEIAIYKLEKGLLKFLFPPELKIAGTIPLSSSIAVSARTAAAKKAELFNNFAKVKHASVFESVRGNQKEEKQSEQFPIQKLISAPVLDRDGDVVGVIQICRKGADLSCVPDFSLEDLKQVELAAKALGETAFMQPLDE